MPARKIPKNYRNVTGIAAHSKALGQAMFESTLERDFISLLQFDPKVETFEVQPLRIEWLDANERPRSYTPDVLVYYSAPETPTTLYEAKYRSDLKKDWSELKPKFRAALAYCRSKNWRFKLITEHEVRTTLLENAKFLLPFVRRGPQSEIDIDIVRDAIDELGRSTPQKLLEAIYKDEWNRAKLLPTLWYMLGTKQITTDFNSKITMASTIWRCS